MVPKDNKELKEKFKLIANTIRAYPMQLQQSWDEISAMHLPDDYKNIENVVLTGMGGSALGARMVDSFASDRLRVPFEFFNEYKLPNYVNQKTLVICYSYSGNTEETVECTYQALNKGAKVFGITTGGKLADIMEENKIPAFIIDEKHNPSGQPRMSLGYAAGSILALFNKLGVISVLNEEIETAIARMNEVATDFHEHTPTTKNIAKNMAAKLRNKLPIIVSSEHLVGTTHAIKNQFNENAKTFALQFDIPELNHHLMEGLLNPKKFKEMASFLFIHSSLYTERVQKRYAITEEVVSKNGYEYHVYNTGSKNKLSEIFEVLIFGSFMTYFLTEEYDIDPLQIPWVDYFKDKMAK